MGTVHSVLPLGEARNTAYDAFAASTSANSGACDEWFIDDGQAFVRPLLADKWVPIVRECSFITEPMEMVLPGGSAPKHCHMGLGLFRLGLH